MFQALRNVYLRLKIQSTHTHFLNNRFPIIILIIRGNQPLAVLSKRNQDTGRRKLRRFQGHQRSVVGVKPLGQRLGTNDLSTGQTHVWAETLLGNGVGQQAVTCSVPSSEHAECKASRNQEK